MCVTCLHLLLSVFVYFLISICVTCLTCSLISVCMTCLQVLLSLRLHAGSLITLCVWLVYMFSYQCFVWLVCRFCYQCLWDLLAGSLLWSTFVWLILLSTFVWFVCRFSYHHLCDLSAGSVIGVCVCACVCVCMYMHMCVLLWGVAVCRDLRENVTLQYHRGIGFKPRGITCLSLGFTRARGGCTKRPQGECHPSVSQRCCAVTVCVLIFKPQSNAFVVRFHTNEGWWYVETWSRTSAFNTSTDFVLKFCALCWFQATKCCVCRRVSHKRGVQRPGAGCELSVPQETLCLNSVLISSHKVPCLSSGFARARGGGTQRPGAGRQLSVPQACGAQVHAEQRVWGECRQWLALWRWSLGLLG